MEVNSIISNLPISSLLEKGIKLILLDVDGTLLTQKNRILSEDVKDWVLEAKKSIKIHLLSNNISEKRIKSIAEQLKLTYTFAAGKPSRKALIKSISINNFRIENTAIIGDKVLTDIIAGNRLGIYTVLVKPIRNESKTINFIGQKIYNFFGVYK